VRAVVTLLLLLTAGQALAQTPPPAVPPGLPSPSQAPIPPFPSKQNSTPLAAGVAETPVTVAPPSFDPAADELGPNDIGLRNADRIELDSDNNASIIGNVILRYRTYTLYADRAVVNADTGIGVLDGHVRVVSDDKTVTITSPAADSQLTLDLRRGIYHVIGGSAVIGPSNLPEVTGLALPIRLYGGDIEDTPKFIDARDTSITTCDFATPHYFFKAKSTTIIPGKRLIARNVTLYRRRRRIITIPYLLFPLDNKYARQGITPQIGEDSEEGYFAKFAYPYVLAASAVGILRLDLMSKEGVGTGFTQGFVTGGKSLPAVGSSGTPGSLSNNAPTTTPPIVGQGIGAGVGSPGQNGGTLQLYHISNSSTGLNTTTGSLADNQIVFHDMRLAIDSQFQNDSYLSSSSQSNAISSMFALSRTVKGATTALTTNIQQSDYGEGTSRTITTSIDENNALSKTTSLALKVDYSQFDTPGYAGVSGTSQDTLATNLNLTMNPKNYQIELLTNTFDATSSTGSPISGGVQRLPELSITSVPSKTNVLWPRLLPALTKFMLDIGDFKETIDNTQDMRFQFGVDTGNNTHKAKAVTTSFAASFLQSFYSDNTAQYILQNQFGATYAFQKQSTFGATYSYLRPYGYTPFLFDESGSYNNINVNLNYQPTKRLLATISSGFDVGQDHAIDGLSATPWLDINGQIQYRIDKTLLNVLTSSYDPNRGMLFNVSDTTRVTLPWGMGFNSALNYVPQTGRFSDINGDLNVPWITDKREQAGYTLRALAGYDGETGQVTYDGFELTRSWHDWEISGIYQNNTESATPGSSFYINFRLKAFPGYEPFGVGQFGQGLDTGIGQVY
jgi:hypothetical protein